MRGGRPSPVLPGRRALGSRGLQPIHAVPAGGSLAPGDCTNWCTTPGATTCAGNAVQTCDPSHHWGAAVACDSNACADGACSGPCTPGAVQCSGNGVETCSASGTWGAPEECTDQTCVAGVCTGVCSPLTDSLRGLRQLRNQCADVRRRRGVAGRARAQARAPAPPAPRGRAEPPARRRRARRRASGEAARARRIADARRARRSARATGCRHATTLARGAPRSAAERPHAVLRRRRVRLEPARPELRRRAARA